MSPTFRRDGKLLLQNSLTYCWEEQLTIFRKIIHWMLYRRALLKEILIVKFAAKDSLDHLVVAKQ